MTAAIPDEFPEDIMRAAWMVVGDLDTDFTFDGQTSGNREMRDAQIDIARAILAERNRATEAYAFVDWVETWVSNPVGAYSVHALDGLFGMARDRIAAIRNPTGE